MKKTDFRTAELPGWARRSGGRLILSLRVQPGARRTAVAGPYGDRGDRLKIALHAPPVDGKANEELIRFLGETLHLRLRQIEIVAGHGSRDKQVAIAPEEDAVGATAARLAALERSAGDAE